ncbi:MAG: alpha/beta fold hydrolase [Candidatus Omnitrophota bacterium]
MSVKVSFSFLGKNNKALTTEDNGLKFEGANNSTVILIHGLTGTPNEMSFLAKFLNKKGYSVVCPRLANHGQPIEILKNTKWQDCYESARRAFLEVAAGGGPIFISGLSMGALFALLLSQEFPDLILGVSCLSPTLFYDGWNTPWSKYLLPLAYATPLKYICYFKEEPPYGIKNEALRAYVHQYYSKATLKDTAKVSSYGYPYFPVTLLCQLHLLVKYLNKKLPQVTVPVQLIQAKDDDMTSVKNSQFIYNRIASKQKELVLLYNSYHVITADQERDKVAGEMERFFTACAKL